MSTATEAPMMKLFSKAFAATLMRNSLFVGISMFTGDFLCQAITKRIAAVPASPLKPNDIDGSNVRTSTSIAWPLLSYHYFPDWDSMRSARMGITGLLVSGPFSNFWQFFLESNLPGRNMRVILPKMLLNGFISPVQISLTFTTVAFLQGKAAKDAQKKIYNDLGSTWLTGFFYWPFVGFLNFRFIPWNWRPLTGSLAGVIWNIYLSNQTNKTVIDSPIENRS